MGTSSSATTQESTPPSSSTDSIITDQEPPQQSTTPSEPTIPESPPPPPTNPYANLDPNVEIDIQTPAPQFLSKKNKSPSPPVQQQPIAQDTNESSSSPLPPSHDKKKGRGGTIASLFKKNASNKRPATLSKLYSSAPHKAFAETLSQILTLGAPGRFPDIKQPQPADAPLQTHKDNLNTKLRDIPIDQAADVFANVVNCMLIHIVDLASSTVINTKKEKAKHKNDKIVVDGVSVVLDFMDFGAQLYEDLFNDYVISPVTYSGSLSKSKLENLFSTYATAQMTNFDTGLANNQDRIDTLQRVFNIPDKRAEGLLQKNINEKLYEYDERW